MAFRLNHPLSVITSKNYWRLNHTSPLLHLEYHPHKLAEYAWQVREKVAEDIPTYTLFEVAFEELPYLKYFEEDASALMITVYEWTTRNEKEVVYTAIFMSWGYCPKFSNAIHLPYFLEREDNKIGRTVKTSLQTIFKCNIQLYNIVKFHILDFYYAFLDNDQSNSADPIVLSYLIGDMNMVDLTFKKGEMVNLWNNTKSVYGNIVQSKLTTYRLMITPVYQQHFLDVNLFDFWRVSFGDGYIRQDGVFNMHTTVLAHVMFVTLNKIMFNRCFSRDL